MILTALAATSVQAQSMSVAFEIGAAESLEDGIDLDFGSGLYEIYLGVSPEPSTEFRIKLGSMNSEEGPRAGDMKYVQGLIAYEFDETWGSTSLFAGPAYYRFEPDSALAAEESEFGAVGGVGGDFPVHRRLSLVVDLAYHWINFDEPYTFLSASGGIRVRF